MVKLLSLLITLLWFTACSQSAKEKDQQTYDKAISYLTDGECSAALTSLAGLSDQNSGEVIEAKAAAYACLAGFNENNFFSNDVPLINASATNKIIPSLVKFSTSTMTASAESSFTYMQAAIDTILYSGPTTLPSAALRLANFGSERGNDLNLQALYLILAQLGKFMGFYGNALRTSGVKGSGTYGNKCIYTYTDSTAVTAISAGLTGSCVNPPVGSTVFATLSNTDKVKILCQGAVLFGNLIDILQNITLPSSSKIGSLGSISSTISSTLCSSGVTQVSAICSLRSQSVCESTYAVGAQFGNLEIFYASFVEANFL